MSIIRIKRSGVSGNPAQLAQGELAYSYLPDNGSNGGDRLYIGTGTEIDGDAVNHTVVGGKFFTDQLDHDKGTLTASSAVVVDDNSKIDIFHVDDLTLDETSISAAGTLTLESTAGDIVVSNGSGSDVTISGVATPTDNADAVNKAYADNLANFFVVTYGVDNGYTDTYVPNSESLTYAGGTALTSTLDSASNTITYTLDNTAVNAGSYGSQTEIPTFTVDQQGRLTAAGTVDVATNLTVNGDEIGLLDSDLTFAADNDISVAYDSDTNTVTYRVETASAVTRGAASFDDSDFSVATGHVSLSDKVVTGIETDNGFTIPTTHTISLTGSSTQGITTQATGNGITLEIEDATTSQKGTVSFSSDDFVLTSGNAELADTVVKQITTDDGVLTPSGHGLSILGGEGLDVNHTGTEITITGEDATTTNKGIASFNTDDFTVSAGAVSIASLGNDQLDNTNITIGTTTIELGDSSDTLGGLTSVAVGNLFLSGNTIQNNDGTGTLFIDPAPVDSDGGTLVIRGDLYVQGTQTIINSTTVSVNDLTLVLADSAADAAAADGAGIIIDGADATLTYNAANDWFETNKDFNVPSGSNLYVGGVNLEELIDSEVANLLTAGEGIDLAYDDGLNELQIAAEIATVTNRGVANFDSDQFTVTSGLVSIYDLDGGTY